MHWTAELKLNLGAAYAILWHVDMEELYRIQRLWNDEGKEQYKIDYLAKLVKMREALLDAEKGI